MQEWSWKQKKRRLNIAAIHSCSTPKLIFRSNMLNFKVKKSQSWDQVKLYFWVIFLFECVVFGLYLIFSISQGFYWSIFKAAVWIGLFFAICFMAIIIINLLVIIIEKLIGSGYNKLEPVMSEERNMAEKKMQIQLEEGSFKTYDGLNLFEQRWQPATEPKAVIVIIHGYAEHSGRYAHVAEYLVNHGYAVETFDLRSHGKSSGKNTQIKSFDEFLSDVDLFLTRVKERHPNTKLFLLAHSMGGTITTLFAITRKPDIKGIILSGATLKLSDEISPLLVRMSSIIGKILPKLPTIKLDGNAVSRDPEIVQKYNTDPLNYRGGIPARTGAEFNRAIKLIQKQMELVTLPLLILSGTADRLSDPEGSKQLYERAQSKDKTLKLYEGLYHEILNEPEKEKVLGDIVAWMDKRV